MSSFALHHGDSREVLKTLAENSVDSIVCDPPYHLTSGKKGGTGPASVNLESPYGRARVTTGFMGMTWDGGDVAMQPEVWAECLRVLKPGGYLLAFSGTRTYHRMTCAIEDAGFEVRDQIGWLYGSGFPKSHNGEWGGTALKPAWEPICMARKPLIGTVEANWREHGTGALNIDGCRVSHDEECRLMAPSQANIERPSEKHRQAGRRTETLELKPEGRWPANIIHDGSDEVLAAFPEAPGQIADISETAPSAKTSGIYGAMARRGEASQDSENEGAVGFKMKPGARRLDEGSAARFFYCAKAGQEDRNEGCAGLPEKAGGMVSNTSGQHITRRDGGAPGPRANHHPTVKPTDLMRYLCRLVTPAGGLILDPFMGSGSTGKAAMLEGFRFVGIDLTPEYVEIARARIEHAKAQGYQPDLLAA